MLRNKQKIKYAGMAQLVEQRIRNAQVIGSSPITSSKRRRNLRHFLIENILLACIHGSIFKSIRIFRGKNQGLVTWMPLFLIMQRELNARIN